MTSLSLSLPLEIREELTALTETGLYSSQESIPADAVRTLFAARPDLRRAVGLKLYEKGRFSLGRTAEWCGFSMEELKEALHQQGIRRRTEDDVAEIEAMARKALEISGRRSG